MRIKTCLALALAGAFSMSAAVATTFKQQYDTIGLAKEASVAVVGEVIGSRSARTDAGFTTIATIKVETAMWGTSAKTLEVELPGGQQKIGKFRISEVVPSSPTLLKGAKFILMLTRPTSNANLTVVGLSQGALSVVRAANGVDAVMLPGAGKLMPVSDAMREIREARSSEKSNNGLR